MSSSPTASSMLMSDIDYSDHEIPLKKGSSIRSSEQDDTNNENDIMMTGYYDDGTSSSHHKEKGTERLARKETRAVNSLKILLFAVLAITTVGVSLGVYFFVSASETDKFEINFEDGANKILASIGRNVETTLATLDGLIVSMVSFAHATNQSWPFVTIDDFAVRTAKIRPSSNLIYINHLPLVTSDQREEWESYSLNNSDWVERSMQVQEKNENYHGPVLYDYDMTGVLYGDFGDIPYNTTREQFLPNWQVGPVVPVYYPFNYDYLSVQKPESLYATLEGKLSVISEAYGLPDENNLKEVEEAEIWFDWYKNYIPADQKSDEPVSDLYMPIFESAADAVKINTDEMEAVGMLAATWFWRDVIKDTLPDGHDGFVVVFENPCNPPFTYQVNGPQTIYLGRGDLHDTRYEKYAVGSDMKDLGSFSMSQSGHSFIPVNEDYCPFHITVYPSKLMASSFETSNPVVYMCVAIFIFMFTSALFICYDWMVRRRHEVVLTTAETSNAVITSLYPEVVRDRITKSHTTKQARRDSENSRDKLTALRNELKSGESNVDPLSASLSSFLSDDEFRFGGPAPDDKPIADVYPQTTVMMASIVGFEAWASAREPTSVFILLEKVYSAFDELSRSYNVFKIESIGDMFVAVSGLPKPEKRHAVIMAQFAEDCKQKMKQIVLGLETVLGPGTADLRLRVGLNSGPVIAGVLRNEKAIFQIFGDTVNVAEQMRRTCVKDDIQCSLKTATEIMNAGRDHWLFPRVYISSTEGCECRVEDTGLETFWVQPPSSDMRSIRSTISSRNSDFNPDDEMTDRAEDAMIDQLPASVHRLVVWNLGQLEQILVRLISQTPVKAAGTRLEYTGAHLPRSERSEALFLMNATGVGISSRSNPKHAIRVLSAEVHSLLSDFVSSIAFMYQENKRLPYHDFEHATSAAMSAMKMLTTPATVRNSSRQEGPDVRSAYIGLVLSDPMVQLGIMFAMLIQSVESRGVPNEHLIKRKDPVALRYGNKSITEQHSLDTAWELFMNPGYEELRKAVFRKPSDILEFRKIVVNAVIATDLEDVELKASQESRWKELFEDVPEDEYSGGEQGLTNRNYKKEEADHNRRAALIIEFIAQISVASEYMQHWKIFEKRTRCHFYERYRQPPFPSTTRSATHPVSRVDYSYAKEEDLSELWYERELQMFDTVVIPVLERIKSSGIFATSNVSMMLDFATQNRAGWVEKGRGLIKAWQDDSLIPKTSNHSLSQAGSNRRQ